MKKLGKLTISPGKIMKNEELINLQGGYDVYCECIDLTNNVHWGSGYCGGMVNCIQCEIALEGLYGGHFMCS